MEGRRLGNYTLLRKLGSGGMGEVWEAKDRRLQRSVALKLLSPHAVADPHARQRFEREARAVAKLTHPHIAGLFEVGEEETVTFLSMELVRGQSLSARLAQGRIPLREALRITRAVAQALGEAHRQGIVHRDIKPSNVMLGERDEVKVVDFGVARLVEPTDEDATNPSATVTSLTETGVILGTMNYMSPEQARGEKVDGRSDLFSLGVLLFETITGRRPFTGPSNTEVLSSILRDPMPEAIDSDDRPVSERLRRLLTRLLAKRPQQRYAAAEEAVAELDLVGAELASSTPAARDGGPAVAPVEFRATDVLLVGDFENHTGDPLWDDAPGYALAVALAQSRHVGVLSPARAGEALRRMGIEPYTRIDKRLADKVCRREGLVGQVAGSVRSEGARICIDLVVFPLGGSEALVQLAAEFAHPYEAVEAIAGMAATLRQHLGEPKDWISASTQPLGRITSSSARVLGHLAAAQRHSGAGNFAAALARLEDAIAEDPHCALAHAESGRMRHALGDREGARRSLGSALSSIDRLAERERLILQGHVAVLDDDFTGADRAYSEFLRFYPDDAQAYLGLGIAHLARLQLGEAEKAFEKSIEARPRDTAPRLNLAEVALAGNRFAEAKLHAEGALKLHPDSLEAILLLAVAALGADDRRTAAARLAELGKGTPLARTLAATYEAVSEMSLGALDVAHGTLARARRLAAKLPNRRPLAVQLWLAAAVESERGDDNALAAALDAVLTEVEEPDIVARAAKLAVRRGLASMARALSERLTAPRPAGEEIRRRAAEALAAAEMQLAAGETTGAIAAAEALVASAPSLEALETLGWAYARVLRFADAAVLYETIVLARGRALAGDHFPHHAVPAPLLWMRAHLTLGTIYESLKRREEAEESYRKLITLWPSAPAAAPLLADARLGLAAWS